MTVVGVYVPFTRVSSAVLAIGSGLIHILKVDTGTGTWIGYQILAGFGVGTCVQIPSVAVQVGLSRTDMPIGNATPVFFNSLGGAVPISVAQSTFGNNLFEEVPKHVPVPGVEA